MRHSRLLKIHKVRFGFWGLLLVPRNLKFQCRRQQLLFFLLLGGGRRLSVPCEDQSRWLPTRKWAVINRRDWRPTGRCFFFFFKKKFQRKICWFIRNFGWYFDVKKSRKNFIEFRCNFFFFFFKWMKRAWNEARNAECVSARISGRSRWVFRSAKGPFWGFFWGRLLDYSELWAQTVANYRDAQQQQLHWLLLRNPRRNNFFLCLIVPFFFFRVEKKKLFTGALCSLARYVNGFLFV